MDDAGSWRDRRDLRTGDPGSVAGRSWNRPDRAGPGSRPRLGHRLHVRACRWRRLGWRRDGLAASRRPHPLPPTTRGARSSFEVPRGAPPDPRSSRIRIGSCSRRSSESLALVAESRLILELPVVFPHHFRDAAELAGRFPDLRLVIDHLGKPPIGSDRMDEWEALIRSCASHQNVYAKISGLNTSIEPGGLGR